MARLKGEKRAAPASPRRGRRKTRKTARPGLLWRLIRWPFRIVVGAVLIAFLWVLAYRVVDPPGGIYMAQESFRLGGIAHDWRDLEEISPRLARAVVAAEDARFCQHVGFDFEAIQEAMDANAEGGRIRGGSTITQQVAKNVFLWHERSYLRKGLEAVFTAMIEMTWPKRRIVEVYLNSVEFAEGVFGAEAAAQHHFGRPALALTPQQAARLAAVLPSPKRRSAGAPSAGVRRRAASIAGGAETLRVSGRVECLGLGEW